MKNLLLQFRSKEEECCFGFLKINKKTFRFSDGEEDEDEEGISEHSLRQSPPGDDGKWF